MQPNISPFHLNTPDLAKNPPRKHSHEGGTHKWRNNNWNHLELHQIIVHWVCPAASIKRILLGAVFMCYNYFNWSMRRRRSRAKDTQPLANPEADFKDRFESLNGLMTWFLNLISCLSFHVAIKVYSVMRKLWV